MRKYIDLYFTTATILNWQPLFAVDVNKDIVIDAFRYCVYNQRANIWAFVIMDTHIHLVWQILSPYTLCGVQRDMLKFISQTIKNRMVTNGQLNELEAFRVNKCDRSFQLWKRKPLSIVILNDHVLNQKLNYIHTNLFRKGMDDLSYKYSSAKFYATGERNWDFL
ncbi:MAG: transposase [Saprospiraceae bacterium]|nr:transposase [Candidatus Opimibacter skivensis]